MDAVHPALETALTAGNGVLARREHPALAHAIDGALRQGRLARVLPGVYARTADAGSLQTRARAACRADPHAVVTGRAAAVLGGWDDLAAPDEVDVASMALRGPRPGFRFERRRIDPQLVRRLDGLRITTRALTALDLALELGETHLDDALRRGVEPGALRRALALSGGRRGWARLRRAVHAIRDRPWSPLECAAHEVLRRHRVDGWVANRAIYDVRGETLLGYGDLVLAAYRLVIELDGRAYHGEPHDVARDAARDLALARAGWEVVRIPGRLVTSDPDEFVRVVRDLLRTRQGRRPPRAGGAARLAS